MSVPRAKILIEKLISDRLSAEELSELLAGTHDAGSRQAYSDALEVYFHQLLEEESQRRSNGGGLNGTTNCIYHLLAILIL